MTNDSDISTLGFWRKISATVLSYVELGVGFNAVAISTIWAMLAFLAATGTLSTIENTHINLGLFYTVFTVLAAVFGFQARKVYKRYAVTHAQRWAAMFGIYVYVMLAIVGMYLTVR